MTSAPAIETNGLTKRYRRQSGFKELIHLSLGPEILAVDGITLTVLPKEIFGLLGPNGSGKTTLIKMLCTLLLPTAGKARIDGCDIVHDEYKVKRLIGLVASDERSFYWRLTGRQNLHFFGTLYGLSPEELRRRVGELLEMFDLTALADVRFNEYSAGMKQKLAIARGMLHRPRVLFMDEPTKGLDPVSAKELLALIRPRVVDLWGCTIVLATHVLAEAEELCDRVAILKEGRVLLSRTVADLREGFSGHEDHVIKVQSLEDRHLPLFREIPGVVRCSTTAHRNGFMELEVRVRRDSSALPEMLTRIVHLNGKILGCERRGASLESVFHALMESGAPEPVSGEAGRC